MLGYTDTVSYMYSCQLTNTIRFHDDQLCAYSGSPGQVHTEHDTLRAKLTHFPSFYVYLLQVFFCLAIAVTSCNFSVWMASILVNIMMHMCLVVIHFAQFISNSLLRPLRQLNTVLWGFTCI